MSKIRVGRLRKLAKHLRGEHLAHYKFNFCVYARGKMDKDGNYCGTAGCAIGEFPAVWPKEWEWVLDDGSLYNVIYKNQVVRNYICYENICEFFSITEEQVNHLFISEIQKPALYGGKYLFGSCFFT